MGVYIPNMQVPKTCGKCLLVGWHYVFDCRLDECDTSDTRMPSCPLVEVKPHGRLIDADALAKNMRGVVFRGEEKDVLHHNMQALLNAPTIIEAEGEE